jgi:RsmE family RNA methyltransferase
VNVVLLEAAELDSFGAVTLADRRAAHLLNVLNASVGRTVRIGVIDGPLGIGTVTAVRDGTVTMTCQLEREIPPRPHIDLLLALPRPKVMRRLWAPLASLGVGRIMLTNAERVERHYFDTHILDAAHYRPLLIEGLQQARDTRLPLVSIHRQFRVLIEAHLEAIAAGTLRVAADPSASDSIHGVVTTHSPERLLMAIGPEGGWNDFERSLLQAHGFHVAGMGARTLRSDTACVALLTLAHDAMRE